MYVAQKRIRKDYLVTLPPPPNPSHRLTSPLWTVDQQRRKTWTFATPNNLTQSGMLDRENWESMNFGETSAYRAKRAFFSMQDHEGIFSALRAHGHTSTVYTHKHTHTSNRAWTCKSSYIFVKSWAQTHNDTHISIQPTNRRSAFGTKLQIPNLFPGKSHGSAYHIIHNEKIPRPLPPFPLFPSLPPSPSPQKKRGRGKRKDKNLKLQRKKKNLEVSAHAFTTYKSWLIDREVNQRTFRFCCEFKTP